MTDALAISLYRVDNPDGIWEYEDEAVRLHYRLKANAEKVVIQSRDRLLAEKEVLARERKELLALQRKNDKGLADCRAAARFWDVE